MVKIFCALFLATIIVYGCAGIQPITASPEEPALSTADQNAVRSVVSAFIDRVWIQLDEQAIVEYMTEDGIFILFRPYGEGKDRRLDRDGFVKLRRNIRVKNEEKGDRNPPFDITLGPAILVPEAKARVEAKYRLKTVNGQTYPSKRIFILEKRNGSWVIIRISDVDIHSSTS